MQRLPDALAPFAAYRQFIAYLLVPSKDEPGKMDKLPVDVHTGRVTKKDTGGAHDPAIWVDAQTAIDAAQRFGPQYGVAFVFTENDPFFFLDIDKCLLPDGSGWSAIANQLCAAFPGAAIEISQSGRGLHLFGQGVCPAHGKKNKTYGLELYTEKRFVALTGTGAVGNAALDFSYVLPWLVTNFFPPGVDGDFEGWTDGPCEGWRGPADDDVLLDRALRSHSAAAVFGDNNRASFADLFERNLEVLCKAYPDGEGGFDESTADMALAQHLAFWTGKDCERIYRLMLRSSLVRDKWERDDYLKEFTIPKAIGQQRDVLCDRLPEPVAYLPSMSVTAQLDGMPAEMAEARQVTGATYMGIDAQIDMFRGCVYVVEQNRILVPGGALLRPEQFRVVFGGYTFSMDATNERTSRDAYETFTQNQAYRSPRVDSTCFQPGRAYGEIVRDAGRSRVNTYWHIDVPRKIGDPTPFLNHLAKLLPNDRDRAILLAYMCACVQHKGVKFQWAPLLQGVEGNGKTLLARCVAEAVGKRYVHWPKASKLAKEFNAWMVGRLFYAVEDIYVPGNKREIFEDLKPMITGDDLEIEGKGVDQISADICGNFMLNSNHKDAVPKTRSDRRICNFHTAQQHKNDLSRDGMDGDYFPRLYDWLKKEDGYAIVAELLYTMPIPDELNPATKCQRAPETSSTEEAISESMGGIEQEILEAIAQQQSGFRDGWVSSIALGNLLDELNHARRLPPNKRRDLMVSLGYVYHPALRDGRLGCTVLPDGGKPRLFIRSDHPARYMTTQEEIARAYTTAQGIGAAIGVMQ